MQKDAFRHTRAQKNAIVGGIVILMAITILSAVSSYMIYSAGFADFPFPFKQMLGLFAVIVVEGAFIWLLYGFTRAFSSWLERALCVIGIGFLVTTMLTNLITHFMAVKRIALAPFQREWVEWGAVTVFVGVLLITLFITLADPVIRLVRLQLRLMGKQRETEIERQAEALEDGEFPEDLDVKPTSALTQADEGKVFRR